jgi:Ca2+-binding RTX toxin-like protein
MELGVTIYLSGMLPNEGPAGHDEFVMIERLLLTEFDDILYDDSSEDNVIEEVRGFGGDDRVYLTGTTPTTVLGGDGNDLLRGSFDPADERLYGGAGDDTVQGNGGTDLLDGGGGQDEMTGGAGVDTFVFKLGYAAATITDFAVAEDLLKLDTFFAAEETYLVADDGAGGATLTFEGGDVLSFDAITTVDVQAAVDAAYALWLAGQPAPEPAPSEDPARHDSDARPGADSFGGPAFVLSDGEWLLAG